MTDDYTNPWGRKVEVDNDAHLITEVTEDGAPNAWGRKVSDGGTEVQGDSTPNAWGGGGSEEVAETVSYTNPWGRKVEVDRLTDADFKTRESRLLAGIAEQDQLFYSSGADRAREAATSWATEARERVVKRGGSAHDYLQALADRAEFLKRLRS